MKLPEFPKRKVKAPASGRATKLQAPAFLDDLYRDMRDRRLIIPAVVLLIAILALPALLSQSADSTVTTPVPVDDPTAVAVEPAVLAVQEAGVRDFRERLDSLQRKNPFGSRFDPQPVDDLGPPGELVEPPESSIAGDGGGTAAPVPGAVDTPTEPTDPAAPSDPPSPVDPADPYVLVPRVDVVVGVVDRERRQTIENVRGGDLLPSRQVPVVMYLGNTEDSKYAEFLVSRDVAKVSGEGKCRPEPEDCEFLRLGQGDTAYLNFADGNRYVLRVKKISFAKVKEENQDKQDKQN